MSIISRRLFNLVHSFVLILLSHCCCRSSWWRSDVARRLGNTRDSSKTRVSKSIDDRNERSDNATKNPQTAQQPGSKSQRKRDSPHHVCEIWSRVDIRSRKDLWNVCEQFFRTEPEIPNISAQPELLGRDYTTCWIQQNALNYTSHWRVLKYQIRNVRWYWSKIWSFRQKYSELFFNQSFIIEDNVLGKYWDRM